MSIMWLSEYWKTLLPTFVYGVLVYAVFTDIRFRLIPNWISIVIICAFIGFYVTSNDPSLSAGHFFVSFIVLTALLPLFAFKKMGAGDIKLISALSLWMGPTHIVEFLSLTALLGGMIAILYLVRTYVAMGLVFMPVYGGVLASACLRGSQTVPYAIPITFAALYLMFQLYGGLV